MKIDIEPFWVSYEKWEDYKNGIEEIRLDRDIANSCFIFFKTSGENIYNKMKETTRAYPISTQVNFTNRMFNPVSWLGQATCNYLFGATSKETVFAWLLLDEQFRKIANETAKQVIEDWRANYESIQ